MYQARLIQTTILTVHLAEAKDKTCKNVVHNSSLYKSIHTSIKYYELDQIKFLRTTNQIQSNKCQGKIFKSLNNGSYECKFIMNVDIYIFVLKAQSSNKKSKENSMQIPFILTPISHKVSQLSM